MVTTRALLVALVLLLPLPASAGPPTLPDVRWWALPGATQITLSVRGAPLVRSSLTPSRLVVDLWPVPGGLPYGVPVRSPHVRAVRLEPLCCGVLRVVIGLRGPVRYRVFTSDGRVSVIVLPAWGAQVALPRSVAYRKVRVPTGAGTTRVHVVTVDPRDPALEIRPVLGTQVVPGSESTGAAATRLGAVVAINGGFFAHATGHPLGLIVIDGRVLSTPWGRRSAFAVREDRTPVIGTFAFRGTVRTPRGIIPISAVNRPPRLGGVALYTPEYGPRTPPDALHAVVRGGRVVAVAPGRVAIPPDGYVLTASSGQVAVIEGTVKPGDPVEVRTSVHPGGIQHALGAGPRLVRDGYLQIPYAWEGFRPSLYRVRTSRSAVGITRAGKVLLVAVEGRNRQNTGMSLVELARLMRDLGAVQAMNLDGGGSATLVVGGRVVNRPERAQRPVSSMLVVRYGPQE